MKSNFKLNCCFGCLALLGVMMPPGVALAGNLEINTGRVNVRMSGNGNLLINTGNRYVNFSSTGVEIPNYRSSSLQPRTRPHYSGRSCQSQNYQSNRVSRAGNNRVHTRQVARTRVQCR